MKEKKVFVEAPLVWIDLEMTGLDINKEVILEIALILTDAQLNEIARGPELVISQPSEILERMDPWCVNTHTASGLVDKVKQSSTSVQEAEDQVLAFLKQHCIAGQSPLCGNSIGQDKLFLSKFMPRIMDFLHYRIIDVSTIKELVQRWYPNNEHKKFAKGNTHRALDDIVESIEELRWYRRYFFVKE